MLLDQRKGKSFLLRFSETWTMDSHKALKCRTFGTGPNRSPLNWTKLSNKCNMVRIRYILYMWEIISKFELQRRQNNGFPFPNCMQHSSQILAVPSKQDMLSTFHSHLISKILSNKLGHNQMWLLSPRNQSFIV